jgi:hypothetical protein
MTFVIIDINDRNIGAEVIRASLMLTTALSLGAAVSEASSDFSNTHQLDVRIFFKY